MNYLRFFISLFIAQIVAANAASASTWAPESLRIWQWTEESLAVIEKGLKLPSSPLREILSEGFDRNWEVMDLGQCRPARFEHKVSQTEKSQTLKIAIVGCGVFQERIEFLSLERRTIDEAKKIFEHKITVYNQGLALLRVFRQYSDLGFQPHCVFQSENDQVVSGACATLPFFLSSRAEDSEMLLFKSYELNFVLGTVAGNVQWQKDFNASVQPQNETFKSYHIVTEVEQKKILLKPVQIAPQKNSDENVNTLAETVVSRQDIR